ncbi:hypothetical protein ERO13_A09G020000v2 [Gossypium hirsutum]|uniref:Aldose 1-epimerase n=1 Tax=Gossypium hirsutum TaxID=3635 RepID=A0A1U8HWG2_GOSHI|nr:galactose mutarotase-like [Gossypium hirsutum]KAG4182048.1 hypothetical protein ERO13_A09G020000v2 [Gossypium hirsutum]
MNKLSFLLFLLLVVSFAFVNGEKSKDDKSKDDKSKDDKSKDDKSKHEVGIYELKNGNMSVKFTNWGASVISIFLPDKDGKPGDIVLGYDDVKEYMSDANYFGSVLGRVANRIAGAKLPLNGAQFTLPANDGKNTLNGGPKGFSDIIWEMKKIEKDAEDPTIVFAYHSKDGDEGFPGEIKVTVRYLLRSDNRLRVQLKAKSLDKPTPVNLATHIYWNLGNHDSGDILSHKLRIYAPQYTPVNEELIPTGALQPVQGTPYDFLELRTIGSGIKELQKGYDINYVIDGPNDHIKMKKTAVVKDEKSGRVMKLYTNQPGVQFNSGSRINNVKGKGGVIYKPHAGLCLQTQGFPDAVNHPNFPSQIITPEKPYKHKIHYKFTIALSDKKSDKA